MAGDLSPDTTNVLAAVHCTVRAKESHWPSSWLRSPTALDYATGLAISRWTVALGSLHGGADAHSRRVAVNRYVAFNRRGTMQLGLIDWLPHDRIMMRKQKGSVLRPSANSMTLMICSGYTFGSSLAVLSPTRSTHVPLSKLD
jgi:hypothetical protein